MAGIRLMRCCEECGNEVAYADIVKGLKTDEGDLITLDAAELESLPSASGNREINVVEFVPAEQVDPLLLDIKLLPGAGRESGQAVRAAARRTAPNRSDGAGQGRDPATRAAGFAAGA